MSTYTCKWSLSDVSVWCMGAEVATIDDLDCTFEIDSDGDLVAINLPLDIVTGRFVRITDEVRGNGILADTNGHSIWCAGLASVSRHRQQIMDNAGVPAQPAERPEYTGREYHPIGLTVA
jgi:hypothetical protein